MKFLQLDTCVSSRHLGLGLASVIVLASAVSLAPSSHAVTATISFACGKANGKPATVARTKKGDVPLVVWSSEGFSDSGFTPQVRCQQVSARFQSLYKSGQLKYITAGKIDRMPVVCATKKQNSTCNSQNLLYTLKPNSDPQLIIQRLTAIRNRSTSQGLEESAGLPSETTSNSVDLDWLESEN